MRLMPDLSSRSGRDATAMVARPARAGLPAMAVLLSIVLAACSEQEASSEHAPTPVRIAAVTEGPAAAPIEATGLIAARDEQRLSFKVGGLVQQITVREGDTVRSGQLLASLDQTEIEAQVAQARQLAEKAERDLARGEALHADQVIPLEQLQNLRTQAGVARAQFDAVRFNARNATIHAPGDGRVLRRLAEEREFVAPGQVVLVVGRQDSGYVVRVAVADRQVVRIRRGDAVTVQLDAWPGETFTAEVTQVASGADAATGLFQIEAQLAATDRRLVSGMVARLRLAPGQGNGASAGAAGPATGPAADAAGAAADAAPGAAPGAGTRAGAGPATLPHVPIAAVLDGEGERAAVFIADGAVARRREIRVAFITADSVAVREGVVAGDQVIVAGAPYLDDGDPIAVVP